MRAPYWASRKKYIYYRVVRSLLERLSPGTALLDVGSYDTPVAMWGTFERRYAVDLQRPFEHASVLSVKADFLDWRVPERMTVVTCCQVLEHLPNGLALMFARKLLSSGVWVIVSVPYLWAAGSTSSHVQDPIDVPKLIWLMGGAEPTYLRLVSDGTRRRLVAVFNAEVPL